MLALRYHKRNDVRLEDIPLPEPEKDEIRIKVAYASVCGTDIEEYQYGPLWMSQYEPHPITGKKAPITLGHEFSGFIDKVGENYRDQFEPGDRVASYPIIYCGECRNCKEGNYHICNKVGCLGLSLDGAFQEYTVVPGRNVYRVPDNVKMEHAALAEPIGFCTNTCEETEIHMGDDVVVFGAGGIGLLCAQIAKSCGAKNVVMVARRENRLDAARAVGVDYAIDVTTENYKEIIMDLTKGNGADVVMEATGSNKVMDQVFEVCKVGGKITLTSVFFENAVIDLKKVVNAGRKIIGAVAHRPVHFEQALKMLSDGRVRVEPLISKIVPLENALKGGLDEYINNKKEYIKMLIAP